jgi:hypothetical protein
MVDVSIPGFQKYWTQILAFLNSQCDAIMNKFPEAGSAVQQIHRVHSDIEILARCTPAKVGESSEWATIVNSGEQSKLLQRSGLEAAF